MNSNALLGYPDDARLLIVNADDFGMCHSNNVAIVQALEQGIVSSASLMTVCPWAAEAATWLRSRPHVPFAVHLTLVCEHEAMRWGPAASANLVPSLLAADGGLRLHAGIPKLLEVAVLDEVEIEFRAQIERAYAWGLHPTHLDWHCIAAGGRSDIFEMTTGLAAERGLAMRVYDPEPASILRQAGKPVGDHPLLDSYALPLADKAEQYTAILRALTAGISEWAVHPGLGDAEAQAMEPVGWQVRRTDLDFVVSEAAQSIISEEGIVLVTYRQMQDAWQKTAG